VNPVLKEITLPSNQALQIAQGDLTLEEVDAIVNAANEHLQHGGGVARAIVKRGGNVIREESDRWIQQHGLVPHARPAWTSGGDLAAKYVIHTVGPVWGSGNENAKLREAVWGSLRVADELKCLTIALPAISTGIFGFPKERAASVIFSGIEDYFRVEESNLKIVRLTLLDKESVNVFLRKLENL